MNCERTTIWALKLLFLGNIFVTRANIQGCWNRSRREAGGGACTLFYRSVNPVSTRGVGRLCPTYYYFPLPRLTDLPTSLTYNGRRILDSNATLITVKMWYPDVCHFADINLFSVTYYKDKDEKVQEQSTIYSANYIIKLNTP